MILAIDPGPEQSAWVLIDEDTLKPIKFAKDQNSFLRGMLITEANSPEYPSTIVIEQIASYGMPVGAEVFETCVWTGVFLEAARGKGTYAIRIPRKDVKMHLCGTTAAKDSNIIQALVDMFATGKGNRGKGTKKDPGWFYGFSRDIWQAYALGVTAVQKGQFNAGK